MTNEADDTLAIHFRIGRDGSDASALAYVEGLPGARRLVRVRTATANRLADLDLHVGDLALSLSCLNALGSQSDDTVRRALWESAIVHLLKCFGRDIRFPLQASDIWSISPEALADFEYFRHLRNKHLVHDENGFADAATAAALSESGEAPPVRRLFILRMAVETPDGAALTRLRPLVTSAHEWAESQRDRLMDQLGEELNALPDSAIAAFEDLTMLDRGADVSARRIR